MYKNQAGILTPSGRSCKNAGTIAGPEKLLYRCEGHSEFQLRWWGVENCPLSLPTTMYKAVVDVGFSSVFFLGPPPGLKLLFKTNI